MLTAIALVASTGLSIGAKLPSTVSSISVNMRAKLGSSSAAEAAYDIALRTGYTQEPNQDGTGGWLAHRSDLDQPGSGPGSNWLADEVVAGLDADLSSATAFVPAGAKCTHKPRVLVLYGSLRETSFSRKLAHECARLLELMGADVRVYDPRGLPVRDPTLEDDPKVQELRSLSLWSEAHVWVSPEMHGCITGAFKNQIDWLPLNSGSVRPTQGRTCAVLQVNGGSQSFNAVNELRRLARWMRMPCTTNQSSVAKAWKEFDDDGRMKPYIGSSHSNLHAPRPASLGAAGRWVRGELACALLCVCTRVHPISSLRSHGTLFNCAACAWCVCFACMLASIARAVRTFETAWWM